MKMVQQKWFVIVALAFMLCLTGLVMSGTAWTANWRNMPHSLDNPLYECTKVQHPLWPLTYVPYDCRIHWAGYTKRPTEKKDFHIEAWYCMGFRFEIPPESTYRVKMQIENDDGSHQMYELCRGSSIQSVLPCLEAQCRPERRWH
ncbi:MAG: hypothetical protein R6X11_07150 [Desulfonatronovibrio sp.]